MKVVIDIDEEIYEGLKNNKAMIGALRSGKTVMTKILIAIVTGIPLAECNRNERDLDELEQRINDYIENIRFS